MTENEKNYFFWNEELFVNAMWEMVCTRCSYAGSRRHKCKNPLPDGCAIMKRLPDLVRIAQRMEEPDLEKYIANVGEEISFECGVEIEELLPHVLEAVVKTDTALQAKPDFR